MRHQSNQWEGRRLSRTMQARRRQAWLLVRNESVRGDRLRIQRSCQRAIMAEASEAFSVRECARGKQATKRRELRLE